MYVYIYIYIYTYIHTLLLCFIIILYCTIISDVTSIPFMDAIIQQFVVLSFHEHVGPACMSYYEGEEKEYC
mgnify:CR=1 FL=1